MKTSLGTRLVSRPYKPVICTTPKIDFSRRIQPLQPHPRSSQFVKTAWKLNPAVYGTVPLLGPNYILRCSNSAIVRQVHQDAPVSLWPSEGGGMANIGPLAHSPSTTIRKILHLDIIPISPSPPQCPQLYPFLPGPPLFGTTPLPNVYPIPLDTILSASVIPRIQQLETERPQEFMYAQHFCIRRYLAERERKNATSEERALA